MAKIFGYDNPTEFITSITDMGTQLYANPNDREQLRSQVAMNGFVNGFELRLLKKTKEIIWVRVNELMVNDKEGKTLYFDGTLEDITELKASEESLEKSVSLLRATLESTADGILVVDANGKIVGFNKKAEELWRFPEHLLASGSDDKALAFAIDQLINPESFISKVKELYSKPEAISFDLLEFKDGRIFERYSQPQLLYEKSVGRVWSFRDITKRAMDEKKLVIQFEELQKVNSELDHFVYSVSHDLRAPLSSILGILNIADLENPEATQKKYLGMIRKSISRLDGFIKDILDYSRNTRKEVQSEKIDFLEIMREVQSNLSHMSGIDRLKITIEINDTVPFYADRIRMEIIMNNLLSNSIKYCDRTKESSVFTMSVSTSVEKASIKISDNGIGIKEEHMDKVFNMFYRASETSTGSGLGLYITRETISKLDGTIKVRSEFGQYTAFDIIIPNLKVSAKS